jgi:hypothetical protein
MEQVNAVFRLLGLPSLQEDKPRSPHPSAFELSELGKLPQELILQIATFLPLESTIAFSLCCRPIHSTLEVRLPKNFQETPECFELLTLLARDMPDHVPCYHCKNLHAIKNAKRHLFSAYHSNHYSRLPCWKANDESTRLDFHHNFSFTVLQMALKRYHQHRNYSKLLKLLACNATYTGSNCRYFYTALARIVDGSMMLREHKIIMMPRIKPKSSDIGSETLSLCPHIALVCGRSLPGLQSIIERFATSEEDIPMRNEKWKGLVRRCSDCSTDFALQFELMDENTEAVFATTWKDLGQCRSPMDDKWRKHSTLAARTWPRWQSVYSRSPDVSVCAMFEGKEHVRFDSNSLLAWYDKKMFLFLLKNAK